jgi:hypothetical protein
MTTPKDEKGAEPAAPLFWIADWQYEHLVSGKSCKGPVMVWPDPKDKTGLVPIYATPPGELDSAREALKEARDGFINLRPAWDEAPGMRRQMDAHIKRLDAALTDMKGEAPHNPRSGA